MMNLMKSTSSSLQMALGAWAGGDHAQPAPALRCAPADLLHRQSMLTEYLL